MSSIRMVKLWVYRQSPSGLAIEVSTYDETQPRFWLPKKSIKPIGKVRRNAETEFEIPEWLWLQHRQLCGNAAFEASKARRANR